MGYGPRGHLRKFGRCVRRGARRATRPYGSGMALIYPVLADAPEPEDEAVPDFAELAADLSDQWLVEVALGEDGDEGCFGPLTARAAWELAVGVDQRRPDWAVSLLPLYLPGTADELVAAFDET
jgi:hypothetical protein